MKHQLSLSLLPKHPLTISGQHVTDPPDSQKNFLVVDHKTEVSAIEQAFDSFTQDRKDIAIILINQHVRRLMHLLYTWP
jgi:vacuolar-type H+-ATPase subunit F/Vma7